MAKPTPSKDYKVWLVENNKKVLINKVQRKEKNGGLKNNSYKLKQLYQINVRKAPQKNHSNFFAVQTLVSANKKMFGLDSPELSEEENKPVPAAAAVDPIAAPRSMSAGEDEDAEEDDFW